MPGSYGTTTTASTQYGGQTLNQWIAQVNELALGWYTAIRRPDQAYNVLHPPTAAVSVTPGAASFTIDPNVLLIGAVAIVAVIWIMNQ